MLSWSAERNYVDVKLKEGRERIEAGVARPGGHHERPDLSVWGPSRSPDVTDRHVSLAFRHCGPSLQLDNLNLVLSKEKKKGESSKKSW